MNTLHLIIAEVAKAFLPLQRALSSVDAFEALMRDMGWSLESIPAPIQNLSAILTQLEQSLMSALSGEGSLDDFTTLASSLKNLIADIKDLENQSFDPALAAANFAQDFPPQLLDYLLVEYLRREHPRVEYTLEVLGIIRITYVEETVNRVAYLHRDILWERIPNLLSDPTSVLRDAYGWGTEEFVALLVHQRVLDLTLALGLPAYLETLDKGVAQKLENNVPIPGDPQRFAVAVPLYEAGNEAGDLSVGARLFDLPQDGTKLPGLALIPYAKGDFGQETKLAARLFFKVASNLELEGGIGIKVRPNTDFEVIQGLDDPDTASSASGSVQFTLINRDTGRTVALAESEDGSGLFYEALSLSAGLDLGAQDQYDLHLEIDLEEAKTLIKVTEADGFLQRIIPEEGLAANFNLAVGLSRAQGFYFRGSGGLEINIPTHVSLGPLDLQSVTIGLDIQRGPRVLPATLGATVRLKLGPLTAIVENMGLLADLSFPEEGGDFGPVDLDLRFNPPRGVGLNIDTPAIKGGGFLRIDAARGEYEGALELTLNDRIALKAIGLITTKMPDGSRGFSLLIIVTAEFDPSIQLGLGFSLQAVGGLLGLNRTMKLQPLMEGVRTGAVNSIMFPKDVIANAPKIISDLRAFFLPQEGTFLIGPMVKLTWGTPPLVRLSLGVIIEIPGNIAILGVLRAALPADEAPILVLQVNFAGAIEFDKKRIYFFATLFESRVLFIPIEGEMGLLAAFGDDANFVVSVGGFHPRFNPPPLPIPIPRRVSVNLVNSPTARVRIEGYFAVTTNTAQFGARAELFFGLGAISAEGHLAFDALFQFSPFYFIIEISASFSVKVFSVRVRGSLEGPTPWRASGEGSISLLFFDISVHFDVTWGESRDTLLPPISVMPLFEAEFAKSENWRALLPTGNNLLVTLRKMPAEEAALVLHPVGVLRIAQRALPLELKLDKVGNQKPNDVNRLSVAVTGGGLSKRGDAFEQFAPAQFEDLSDADKLSRPAFEPEPAGLDLSGTREDLRSSHMVKRVVRYEEIILDTNFKRFARRFFAFSSTLFTFFLNGASVAKSDLSQAKQAQFQPFEETVEVQAETFTVAYQLNNQAYADDSVSFASEAMARDFLAREVAKDANLIETLHVIPSYERVA